MLFLVFLGGNWSEAVDVGALVQRSYMKASNGGAGDAFGSTLAMSGETLIVGAPAEDGDGSNPANNASDDAGAAYVFLRSGTLWIQQAILKSPTPMAGEGFGCAVAISHQAAVVGASGAAYVFVRDGAGRWSHQATLSGDDAAEGDSFGWAVGIDSETIVVGAHSTSSGGSGAAYVFVRSGASWSMQSRLSASDPGAGDAFGWSVSVSGESVAVGAPFEDGSSNSIADNLAEAAGAVYVFTRSGLSWSEQSRIKAANAGAADGFGYSVALSGNDLVVGAPFESSNGTGVNGGGVTDDSAMSAGAAYLFARTGTAWAQHSYAKASNTQSDDRFGYAVSIKGDLAAVGAISEASSGLGVNSATQASNAATEAGAVFAFGRAANTWSQSSYLKASNTGAGDQFGTAVVVVGDMIVSGAPFEDSNGTTINPGVGAEANNTSVDSGAVYAFGGSALNPLQSWRLAYFGDIQNADASDADSDGLKNLQEFAFGTDPTTNLSGTPVLVVNGSVLAQRGQPTVLAVKLSASSIDYRALFCRRKDWAAAGLSYTVQFSGDLATWASSSATPALVASDGEVDAVSVRYPFFVNGLKARFFRVLVSGPP